MIFNLTVLVQNEPEPQKSTVLEAETLEEVETPNESKEDVKTCNLETNKCDLLIKSEINESDYVYADYVISNESNWNYKAINEETGSVGLCQLNPNFHEIPDNYYNNPIVQLNWCNWYATESKLGPYSEDPRYGSWQAAASYWNPMTGW